MTGDVGELANVPACRTHRHRRTENYQRNRSFSPLRREKEGGKREGNDALDRQTEQTKPMSTMFL